MILNILEKNGYDNYKTDFNKKKNKKERKSKDVDFCIRLSNKEELLLEIWTPYDNKWFPYEKGSRRPIYKDSQPTNREEAIKKSKEKYCYVVGEPWQREVAYKILLEANDRMDKFENGKYEKFLLINLSGFDGFDTLDFEDLWIKFLENGKGFVRGEDKKKDIENLEKLKEIKDFYTGFIFLSITESGSTEFVDVCYKLFKNTSEFVIQFINCLLKENKSIEI